MSDPITTEPKAKATLVAEPKPENQKTPKKRGPAKGSPQRGGNKGWKAPQTIERLAAKRHMLQRIAQSTDALLNAQLNKAFGETFLMVRVTTGKGKTLKTKTEVVTDTETIKDYLIDDGAALNSGNKSNYYYISKKPADNMAIQNLLDRGHGRPTEKVELGGADEGDLAEISDEELDKRIKQYQKELGI